MRIFFPENIDYFIEIQPQIKHILLAFVIVRANFFDFDEIKKSLKLDLIASFNQEMEEAAQKK